jgi:hypothetical protein
LLAPIHDVRTGKSKTSVAHYQKSTAFDVLKEKIEMKKKMTLMLGLLIVLSVVFTVSTRSSSGYASAQARFVQCPANLVAPYGGNGWSTIQVQANFAKAVVTPQGLMTCQYGFGGPNPKPKPFFGVSQPCPAGMHCVVQGNGFRITP